MANTETRPETLYEEASYDLNKFRERRIADRRFKMRDTPDRRVNQFSYAQIQEKDAEKDRSQ